MDATIITAGVGVVGILATTWVARSARLAQARESSLDRQYQRARALDDRWYERRTDAFVHALSTWNRRMDQIRRTHPVWGPTLDPPERPSDEEIWEVSAKLAAFGNERIDQLMKDFAEAGLEFDIEADMLSKDPHGERDPEGKSRWESLVAAREKCQKALNALERAIRAEVRQLPPLPTAPASSSEARR